MRTGHIYYVGPFSFPWGEAASRRVMGVASAIADSGRQVTVFPGRGVVGEPDAPAELEDQVRVVAGLNELSGGRLRRSYKWAWNFGSDTLAEFETRERPDAVIVYGGSFPYLRQLLPWCRRRRIPLFLDMVEWYDPTTFAGGKWGPVALGDRYSRKIQHPRVDGVIAISTLLRDHYEAMGLPVALVPPTFVEAGPDPVIPFPKPVVISYAGTPGAKDELALMLRAFRHARERSSNLEFVIAGPSASDVMAMVGADMLPAGVTVLGRIPQAEVTSLLNRSHFTLLLRQHKLSSNAGFPTKFVESFRAGVPVIGNLTSDLGEYLRDGETGFVCDLAENDVARVLALAGRLTPEEYESMALATRVEADRFHYLRGASALSDLLPSVI